MRQIRKLLKDSGISSRAIYAFLRFMFSSQPLGHSTYDTIRCVNKSLVSASNSYTTKAYSRLIISVERIMDAIIKDNGETNQFNSFVTNHCGNKVNLRAYLDYAKSKRIKVPDKLEAARNTYIHHNGILNNGKINQYCVDILRFFVEFYTKGKKIGFFYHLKSRRVVKASNFKYKLHIVENFFWDVEATIGEFGSLILKIIGLILNTIFVLFKMSIVFIIAGVIIYFVNPQIRGLYGTPFEQASYSQVELANSNQFAELHNKRANIANSLRYYGRKSKTADKMHQRTEELNQIALSTADYPHILALHLPGIEHHPLIRLIEPQISKLDSRNMDMRKKYKAKGRVPLKYDNPPAFELLSNYYYCDYIYLNNLKRTAKMRAAELVKLEGLCQAISPSRNIDVCIAYNYNSKADCMVAEEIKALFQENGVAAKRIKSCNIKFKNQPKLYIRLNNKYYNSYSDLTLSSTSVDCGK